MIGRHDEAEHPQPASWRVVLAFLLAPLVPSVLFATDTLWDGLQNGPYLGKVALIAAIGAYPATLLFGVPIYFLLRKHLWPSLITSSAIGAGVAAAPWALLMLFLPNPNSAISGDHVTVLAGELTWWGVLHRLKLVAECLTLGAIGGAAFWTIAVWGDRRLPGPEAPAR